ncbi:MAG: lysophospholipid acyltransferase family protein [Leptospirillia bacterium]
MKENVLRELGFTERLTLSVLSFFSYAFLRLYLATLRKTYANTGDCRKRYAREEGMILAFWHNQILSMPFFTFGRRCRISTLVSLSRDGELTARIVGLWGIGTVRGSSHRGGISALKELLRLAKDPRHHIALTPDGPQGPPFVVKDGPLILAMRSGRPIIPLAVAYQRYFQLKSWDGFLLPFPFTKAYFVCGDPVHITEPSDPAGLERAREKLAQGLDLTNARAMAMRIPKGFSPS